MGFQGFQDFFRGAVFVPRVEGQVQPLLPGVPQIGGIKLPQLVHPRASYRGRSLLPEAQAPGTCLHAALHKYPNNSQNRHADGQKQNGPIPFSHKKFPLAENICPARGWYVF